jgi:hypothetical protein
VEALTWLVNLGSRIWSECRGRVPWSARIHGVTGRKRWAVVLIMLAAGAVVIVLAFRSPEGLDSAAKVGALIAGLAPLAVGLIAWARRPPPMAPATSTSEQVDAAQRHLADQVSSQWRNEIIVRQLDDPGPLAVRWRFGQRVPKADATAVSGPRGAGDGQDHGGCIAAA